MKQAVAAQRNPFSQQRLEQLFYRFTDGQSWQYHLSRLAQRSFRALIVGPRGTGKSTVLRELHGQLGRFTCGGTSSAADAFTAERSVSRQPVPISQPIQNYQAAEQRGALHSLLLNIPRRVTVSARSPAADDGITSRQQCRWLRQQLAELDPSTVLLIDGWERLGWGTRMLLVHHWARPGRCAGVVLTTHYTPVALGLPVWLTTTSSPAQLKLLLVELGVTEESLHRLAEDYYRLHAGNVREVFRALYDHVAAGRLTY